jgi:hypothetical protein
MDEWQGRKETGKKRKGRPAPASLPDSPEVPVRAAEDAWQGKAGRRKRRDLTSGRAPERWTRIPEKVVNWLKVSYYARISLYLLAALVIAVIIWSMIRTGKRTPMLLVRADQSSSKWLAATPFIKTASRRFFAANTALNIPAETVSISVSDADWTNINPAGFGGPDNNVRVVYLSGTAIATARDAAPQDGRYRDVEALREDEIEADPCFLDTDSGLFDYNRPDPEGTLVRLEEILDRIADPGNALDRNVNPVTLVIIDAQPVESPVHPGLLLDRFPEAVRTLYQKHRDGRYRNLVLVVSHDLGQRNWPMPEHRCSVFAHFVRAALLGAADGEDAAEKDEIVTFREFSRFVADRCDAYAQRVRLASQRPFVLEPGADTDFKITFVKPASGVSGDRDPDRVPLRAVFDAAQQDDRWATLHAAWDRELADLPVLAARAAGVLARIEQLCIYYVESSAEAGQLEVEWENLKDAIRTAAAPAFPAVSLRQIEWQEENLSTNLRSRLLPPPAEQQERLGKLFELYGKGRNQSGAAADPGPPPSPVSASDAAGNQDSVDPQVDADNAAAVPSKAPQDELTAALEEYLSEDKSWVRSLHLAWALWETCVPTGDDSVALDKQELLYWLNRIVDKEVNQLLEVKYLRLLADNVDWQDGHEEMRQRCLKLAIECRNLSEEFLVSQCDRLEALPWFAEELGELEDRIRIAEDHLFAAQYQVAEALFRVAVRDLDPAGELWQKARTIQNAFRVRDRVLREAPYYSVLIARDLLRPQAVQQDALRARPGELSDEWLAMVAANRELGRRLISPPEQPVWPEIGMLAGQVEQGIEQLRQQSAELVKELLNSQPDATVVAYAPDLLICPLILTDSGHHRELREHYFRALQEVAGSDSGKTDVHLLSSTDAFANFVQQARNELEAGLNTFGTSQQRYLCGKHYRKYWNYSHIGLEQHLRVIVDRQNERIEEIRSHQIVNENMLAAGERGQLPDSPLYIELLRFDYWLRSAAPALAENLGRFQQNLPQDDPFRFMRQNSLDLRSARWVEYARLRLRRTIRDFWGDNHHVRQAPWYYERVAARIIDWMNSSLECNFQASCDYRDQLARAASQLLDDVRLGFDDDLFRITSGDVRFTDSGFQEPDGIRPRFAPLVRAGSDWPGIADAGTQVGGASAKPGRPVIAVQMSESTGHFDQPVEAVAGVRRLALPFTTDGAGTTRPEADDSGSGDGRPESPPMEFRKSVLDKYANGQALLMMCFRGHEKGAFFRIIKDIPASEIGKNALVRLPDHLPDEKFSPTIRVNGKGRPVTDIMFVFDCSMSMVLPFELKGADGIRREWEPGSRPVAARPADYQIGDEPPAGSKFVAMRERLRDFLDRLRKADPGGYRVGVIAIGSQATFRPGHRRGDPPLYAGRYLADIPEGLRPCDDARLVAPLKPLDESAFREIEEALNVLRPWGYTPLYLGTQMAAAQLETSGRDHAKMIVLLTDGVEFTRDFTDTSAKSTALYRWLEEKKRSSSIQFQFIGVDLPETPRYADEIARRRRELEQLCGESNFLAVDNFEDVKRRLEELTPVTRFTVSHDGVQAGAPVEINNEIWSIGAGRFERGPWRVEIPAIPGRAARRDLYLYGGEIVQLSYDGNRLALDPPAGLDNDEFRLAAVEAENSYEVHLLPLRGQLKRGEPQPVQFAFKGKDGESLSMRPARVCLEVEQAGGRSLILQDVNYDWISGAGLPRATFLVPRPDQAARFTLRLWYLPFATPATPVYMRLERRNLDGQTTGRFQRDLDGRQINIDYWRTGSGSVYGPGDELKVRLTLANDGDPSILGKLLVDCQTRDGDQVVTQDFEVRRQFPEAVLDPGVEWKTVPGELPFAEHTFKLGEEFRNDVYLAVETLENTFGNGGRVEFGNQEIR